MPDSSKYTEAEKKLTSKENLDKSNLLAQVVDERGKNIEKESLFDKLNSIPLASAKISSDFSVIQNRVGTYFKKIFSTQRQESISIPVAEPVCNVSGNMKKNKRTKVKPRIIDFDDDGVGYDVNSPYLFSKEIKRLAEISLEMELSPRMMLEKQKRLGAIYIEEEQKRLGAIYIEEGLPLKELKKIMQKETELGFCTKEEKEAIQCDKEARRFAINKSKARSIAIRVINRNTQKQAAKEKKINKLLEPVVCAIKNEIRRFKEQASNPNVPDNSKLFNFSLPSFEGRQADLVINFLNYIHYDDFKKLINFAEETLISINEVAETLKIMDMFSENLGLPQYYSANFTKFRTDILEVFCNANIVEFFENSLKLFIDHTVHHTDNNLFLINIRNNQEKIKFYEVNFLDQFISENDLKRILDEKLREIKHYLARNYDNTLFNKQLNSSKNDNFLKIKFLICKKYLFNFFSEKYYFIDKVSKNKFIKKIDLNWQEQVIFESVKNAVFKLKWWDFILKGISPIHLFKKGFKERLAQKLFLSMIDDEFVKVIQAIPLNDENKPYEKIEEVTSRNPYINFVDSAYSILDRLTLSNIEVKSYANCFAMSSLAPKSRQEIIDRLNNNEEIKVLLQKISDLGNNARLCKDDFSTLLSSSKKVMASSERKEKNSPSFFLVKNKNHSFAGLKASIDGNVNQFNKL